VVAEGQGGKEMFGGTRPVPQDDGEACAAQSGTNCGFWPDGGSARLGSARLPFQVPSQDLDPPRPSASRFISIDTSYFTNNTNHTNSTTRPVKYPPMCPSWCCTHFSARRHQQRTLCQRFPDEMVRNQQRTGLMSLTSK
jgi:hypothetical protein